jgi:hypothetical protein
MKQHFKINEYCLHKMLAVNILFFFSKSQSYLIGHQNIFFLANWAKNIYGYLFCSNMLTANILCKQYSFILKCCFIFILLLVRKVSLIKHMLMTDKVIIINKLTYLKANMLCVGIIISWPMT